MGLQSETTTFSLDNMGRFLCNTLLEARPFTLPEHFQNMPYMGGTPDFRVPWDSHPALGYPGLLFTIGGRSLAWGGWSPQLLAQEFKNWPASVIAALNDPYFRQASG